MKRKKHGLLKRKAYLWISLALFVVSIVLHWYYGWKVFVSEQRAHQQPVIAGEYTAQMLRDTMENWQSEFLQLIWQVAGLAFFWYAGSPQSKEGDDRKEEKLNYLIQKIDPENYNRLMQDWEDKYPSK